MVHGCLVSPGHMVHGCHVYIVYAKQYSAGHMVHGCHVCSVCQAVQCRSHGTWMSCM